MVAFAMPNKRTEWTDTTTEIMLMMSLRQAGDGHTESPISSPALVALARSCAPVAGRRLAQLATPSPAVFGLLDTLARDPKNTVFIMSGRERRFMDTWLGKLERVGLAAEFGFCHRMPGEKHWQSIGCELDTSWKEVVQPIMQCVVGVVVAVAVVDRHEGAHATRKSAIFVCSRSIVSRIERQ